MLEIAARIGARSSGDRPQGVRDGDVGASTRQGRALGEGLTHLDEAMLAIVDRDTTPRATSMLYCGAIATCLEAHEWGRAREWTLALGGWLDELPHQSGVYLGNCRIYRSQLWCLGGDWPQALHELGDVCGELHRGFGQRSRATPSTSSANCTVCSAIPMLSTTTGVPGIVAPRSSPASPC